MNNGDHDTFVDDDVAYIAYTDWKTSGTIVIEKLNANYTSGTGEFVRAVQSGYLNAGLTFEIYMANNPVNL